MQCGLCDLLPSDHPVGELAHQAARISSETSKFLLLVYTHFFFSMRSVADLGEEDKVFIAGEPTILRGCLLYKANTADFNRLRLDGESGNTSLSRGWRQKSGEHLMVVPLPSRFEPSKPNASPLFASVGG